MSLKARLQSLWVRTRDFVVGNLKARLQSLWVRTRDFVVGNLKAVNNSDLKKDVRFFVKTHWASPLAWFPILGAMLAVLLVVINYTCEMPLATRKFLVTTGFGGLVYFLPLLWQGLVKDFKRVGGFYLPTYKSLLLNVFVTLAWAFSIHYIASLAGGTSFWRSMYLNGSNFHSAAADSWLVLAGAITLLASFITLRVLQKMEWRTRWSP